MSPRIRRNIIRWALRIAIVIAIVGAGFGFWLYRDLHAPVAHAKANDYIEIPRGSTPDGIADKLIAAGVLRRKWPLLLYLKSTGKAKTIRAGEYRFPSPISPLGVLAETSGRRAAPQSLYGHRRMDALGHRRFVCACPGASVGRQRRRA